MTIDERDRELSRLFEAERRADESSVPDLDVLLARRPRRRMPGGRRIAYALALAAMVTLAILLVPSGTPRRITPPAEGVQIAEWTSPTAFLLETPGSELLTQIPTLASLPITADANPPQPTKGVAR